MVQPTQQPNLPTAKDLMEAARAGFEHERLKALRAFDERAREEFRSRAACDPDSFDLPEGDDAQVTNDIGELVRAMHADLVRPLNPVLTPAPAGNRATAKLREAMIQRDLTDAQTQIAFEEAVQDAMFSLGCIYTGTKGSNLSINDGVDERLDPGQTFSASVAPCDLTHDPNATGWGRGQFVGHRYLSDRDELIAAGFSAEILRQIPAIWEGGAAAEETSARPGGQANEDEDLRATIMLWDLCFRHQGRLYCCTLPPFDGPQAFIVEPYLWEGPDLGPYEFIELGFESRSLRVKSPVSVIFELHKAKQTAASRIVDDILNTKRNYVAKPANSNTVMQIKDAKHDQVVFGDPDGIKEFLTGGMARQMVEGLGMLTSLSQQLGPNVNLMAGREDPSNSATVGAILAGNARKMAGQWHERVQGAAINLVKRYSVYLDSRMGERVKLPYQVPGGRTISVYWDRTSPMLRDTSWLDYEYAIAPFADKNLDPRQQQAAFVQVAQILMPLVQMTAAMGGDVQAVIDTAADVFGMPSLHRMFPTQSAQEITAKLQQWAAMGGTLNPMPQQRAAAPASRPGALPRRPIDQHRSDHMAGSVPAALASA